MNYTYDTTDQAFYEKVWDLLVEKAGASKDPYQKESFVSAYTQIEHSASEWRFGGLFGFGGKFWRNAGTLPCPFYVALYREDRTPQREALLHEVNRDIEKLAREMNPNPWGPRRK